jgi:hypothetical protein
MVKKLSALSDYKKRGGIIAKSYWPNPFVITVQDKYHRVVYNEIYTKIKNTLLEVLCPPLRKQQIQELCLRGCKEAELELSTQTINQICATSANLPFILNQLQWMALPCPNRTGKDVCAYIDHRELNLFACAQKLMNRTKGDKTTACKLPEYLTMWERSPEKVTQSMFNSYPDFVTLSLAPTSGIQDGQRVSRERYRKENEWRLEGMDELVLLSESFSDEDIFASSTHDPKMAAQIRCSAFWATLHDQVGRATGGQIQPPTEPRSRISTECLRRCNIDRREFERLQGVKLLHQIATEIKTSRDAKFAIPRDFLLSEQIGFYQNGFAQEKWERTGEENICSEKMDMFFDYDSQEPKRKKSKRQSPNNLGPRFDAAQILSHTFSSL